MAEADVLQGAGVAEEGVLKVSEVGVSRVAEIGVLKVAGAGVFFFPFF